MARYIDADTLIKKIFPYDGIDKKLYSVNAQSVYNAIENSPAADVAPKSEVQRLYYNLQAVLEERAETKQEIAREIFELVECAFSPALVYEGHTVKAYIAELKKKYTEN